MSRARSASNLAWRGQETFETRAAAIQALADGWVPVVGQSYPVGPLEYIGAPILTTTIPDMPGFVPPAIWTPLHFGCAGNGTADDGAKLNIALAAYRTAIEALDTDNKNGAIVFDGLGLRYRSTVPLDWTETTSWGWQFRDMTIVSEAEGLVAWEAIGSRGGTYWNFSVEGSEDHPPAFGIVAARSTTGGSTGFCDHVGYYACRTRGFFTDAAVYFYGQESSTYIDCEWWNSADAPSGIIAGVNVLPIPYTHSEPIDAATSHINSTYLRNDFRHFPTVTANVVSFTATNPLTVTYDAMPFANGETVAHGGDMDGPEQLYNLKATITGISGNTATYGAVDATGWASLSGACAGYKAQTTPSLIIAGGLRGHTFSDCYVVNYGADGMEIRRTASDGRTYNNLFLDNMLFEGFGQRSHVRFVPTNAALNMRGFRLSSYACRAREGFISVQIDGAASFVNLYSPKLLNPRKQSLNTVAFFQDAARSRLYNADVDAWDTASHDPSAHAVFTGKEASQDTGVREEWYLRARGDIDWVVQSAARPTVTRLNSRNASDTVLGYLQFNQATQNWVISYDGTSTGFVWNATSFYGDADNTYSLGLASRRWSTVHAVNVLAAGNFGYATGQGIGGTVTQLTSKTTAVDIGDDRTGDITTNNSALGAGASADFEVTGTAISTLTIPVVAVKSASTNYTAQVVSFSAGRFRVRLTNISAGSRSEAVPITFALINSANS